MHAWKCSVLLVAALVLALGSSDVWARGCRRSGGSCGGGGSCGSGGGCGSGSNGCQVNANAVQQTQAIPSQLPPVVSPATGTSFLPPSQGTTLPAAPANVSTVARAEKAELRIDPRAALAFCAPQATAVNSLDPASSKVPSPLEVASYRPLGR